MVGGRHLVSYIHDGLDVSALTSIQQLLTYPCNSSKYDLPRLFTAEHWTYTAAELFTIGALAWRTRVRGGSAKPPTEPLNRRP